MSQNPHAPENLFLTTLAQLEAGDLARDASAQLADLTKAVRNEQKSGTLTLKFTMKPRGKNGQVEVSAEIVTKEPQPERGVTMFFSTEHGQLVRKNPAQRELDLGDEDEDAPRVAGNQ